MVRLVALLVVLITALTLLGVAVASAATRASVEVPATFQIVPGKLQGPTKIMVQLEGRTGEVEVSIVSDKPSGKANAPTAVVEGGYLVITMPGYLARKVSLGEALAATLKVGLAAGDVDGDGDINGRDLHTLASRFGDKGTGAPEGDLNGDGKVDITDLALLGKNFRASSKDKYSK